MALAKQSLPIPIDGGLETKLDPKQEEIGYFRKMENVIFDTVKQLKKRNGYDNLPLKTVSGASVDTGRRLARFKDDLVFMNSRKLYSYSSSLESLVERGNIFDVTSEEDLVYKDTSTQTDVDGLVVENLRIFAWEDTAGGVYYSVQDLEQNTFVVSGAEVSATGENPVIAAIGSKIFIAYGDGADINFRSFELPDPTSISAETTVISNRAAGGLVDAQSCGDKIIVAYNSSVGAAPLSIFSVNSSGVPSSVIGVTGEDASDALDLTCDSSERIVITYSNGSEIKITVYPLILITTPILAPTVVESVANVTTCCSIETTSGNYRVYYEVDQASSSNNFVKQADVSLAGSVTGVQVFMRSVGLSARAFKHNNEIFVPVVHESTLQSTYFIANEDQLIVTKFANQTAGGVIDFGVLPEFSTLEDDKYFTAFLVTNRLRSDNGTFFSTTGVASVIIDFSPNDSLSYAELASNLHICAGVLRVFDGSTVSEHGFHVFPETLAQDSTATVGGFMSDGTYNYVAVYRWTDNFGQDHRSAPTQLPLQTVLSGGTSTQTNTIQIPTLRLTEKVNPVIELYRTEDAGTTYYLVSDPATGIANDKTVDTVNFVDTISDADLIDNELLYTTGNVIENVPAPACKEVTVYNSNRLAVIGKDANRVFFSKEIGESTPVEFTDLIYRDVDPVGGPIDTIKSMDDKLVIFETDATYFISGNGPNNLLQQDTFTQPEIVSTEVGCVSPRSVVLTPGGLMFQSRKGIWMISRDMSPQYQGARVEGFNGQKCTSAQIVGESNQVRFLLENDRALVYNYNLDRWATYENHGGLSSVTIENDYYYLREDGSLYKENRNSFADNTSPIKMRLESGWMNVAGMQNFQRVYHLLVLAAYKSSHKLRVKVAYDFKEAWVQEQTIDPKNFLSAAAYGTESPYGAGTFYGGDGALYQFRLNLTIQKCQSIKICIEDIQETASEGLALSGITFRVGVKEGTNKLAAANKFGTEG